ncbi:hypothetical protein BDF20DRAFT_810931 [Mycotypha africana]|uniref:uncharacterized protein n=1 Tax=Mycotypha africana TaxID=64632 RepID=UPI002301B55B|nr:uncharacterized protein BDF20DRAFT_810931 [Mycotypha africana]KAI8991855.1 hypothetical protein BDF20DRAFT_810931 [Mycotypha africana]
MWREWKYRYNLLSKRRRGLEKWNLVPNHLEFNTLPDIDVAKGTIHVLVDNSWRLDPSAQTYESIIYIVSSGVNPQDEMYNRNSDFPAPVSNFVERKY